MMPKIDGVGVLASLSENPAKKKNGPIVLLTNLSHDPVLNEALKMGANSYLIKADLNPNQFIAKVKEFVS